MHFHFYEFPWYSMWRHDQALPCQYELRCKKITRSEKSLICEKSLPITNSLLYSNKMISRYHWKLKITFPITI